MTTSVIVCAYTLNRWTDLQRAVASLTDQTIAPDEVLVVIDHNDELFETAKRTFTSATVLNNAHEKGLSGARNTGVLASSSDVILFLDDDAYADTAWIEATLRALEDPSVVGVGSWIEPNWEGGEPNFFPESFRWVMGCSYSGLPPAGGMIRNPIGAGMALRREVFTQVGGFSAGLGRIGTTPLGCEETELAIRYSQHRPDARFVHAPDAVVHHFVPRARLSWSYFLRRCWSEGLSKAAVAKLVGATDGLSEERRHALRVLPREFFTSLIMAIHSPRDGIDRAARIVLGMATAATGVLWGTLSLHGFTKPVKGSDQSSTWRPLPIVQMDVDETIPLVNMSDSECTRAWVEYWRGERFVGRRVEPVVDGVIQPSLLPTLQLGTPSSDAPPPPLVDSELPWITVVVCTLFQNPELNVRALNAIVTLEYPKFDLVVVDNRRADGGPLIEDWFKPDTTISIKIVRELYPGISAARNRGIFEARGEIVAFTDDDVVVSEGWLRAIGERFVRSPEVAGMGGLVLPAELEHEAQLWFEEYYGGFSRNYSLEIVSPETGKADPSYPYAPGRFAAGANMAFRRDALVSCNGFSLTLGTGTLSRGGEDLDIFLRLALAEKTLCFDPLAVVRHSHRDSKRAFRRQLIGYGGGLTAMYTELICREPRHLWRMIGRAPGQVRNLFRSRSERSPVEEPSFPRHLRVLEAWGAICGPWWNIRARQAVRRPSDEDARTALSR